jgi:predicted TIM-barrel fold metal-dependent hydrolase
MTTKKKAILVDTNIHVIAPPELRWRYPLNIYPGTEAEFTESQTNPPEAFLRRMDEAGLDQAYLMASRFHGFDNSYCADALLSAPKGKFIGVANVDILAPDAPDKVSYWIQDRGMHGIRFWGGGPVAGHRFPGDERGLATWVDDPQLTPVWERVRDLGVPSNAQATMPEVLPNTRRLLNRFPELPFTLNNLTHVPADQGPDSEAARDLLVLAEFPRTYVNFSINFVKQTIQDGAAKDLLRALIDRFSARRLIWSSFGQALPGAIANLQDGLAWLPEDDRLAILGEGARDLYPALRDGLPS